MKLPGGEYAIVDIVKLHGQTYASLALDASQSMRHCGAAELHLSSSTQPSPETHRTGLPALLSTSASVSSSGKLRVHASSPSSARSALSAWGFRSDRRSS